MRKEVNFNKRGSKNEYRLSLPQEIQNDADGNPQFNDHSIVAIYQYDDGINIDLNNNQLDLNDFLTEFKSRRGPNNAFTSLT